MVTLSLKVKSTRFKAQEIPRKQINRERQARHDKARAWLCQTYPDVFNLFTPKPLAVGTGKLLQVDRPENISNKTLAHVMARWTHGPTYLSALATGDFRYRPDGTPAEAISDLHRREGCAEASRRPGEEVQHRSGDGDIPDQGHHAGHPQVPRLYRLYRNLPGGVGCHQVEESW